ncbi:unnamed protein product [Linum trigynum]|uniref:Uncharacterized protein n=1 Tax=Linum trigynum TaxID=586398 RepID=A0AAV2ECK9_9ROSI
MNIAQLLRRSQAAVLPRIPSPGKDWRENGGGGAHPGKGWREGASCDGRANGGGGAHKWRTTAARQIRGLGLRLKMVGGVILSVQFI